MKRRMSFLAVVTAVFTVALSPAAVAHNRAHVILPSGECVLVGSLKSVSPGPDKSALLDLRPETTPADEIGTAYAADEGNSALQKGPCP